MASAEAHPVRASILVVDDDIGVRESFEAVLAKDYDLHFATQGPEALRILSGQNINLVLLDIRMAEALEDFALAEAIREGQKTKRTAREEVFRILRRQG